MRCPHCGEPVQPGQERCFACGEKLRVRRLHRGAGIDPRIIIFAGVLFIIALAGVLGVLLGGKRNQTASRKPVRIRPAVQIQDSLRRERTADSQRVRTGDEELARLRERVERVRVRYEKVRSQVLGDKPTPEQQSLMSQIQRELGTMNSRVAELGAGVSSARRSEIQAEIAEIERRLNRLISDFARAPKSR
ncbi:MAG: zinc ribbon domain-containing protein [candidate division WOR-3 bacterium]|nr:zinc ribbon domain-containing protein [candidate division WOR-3 bacterium]